MMKPLKIIVSFSILLILFGCPLSQNKSVVLSKNNSPGNAVATPTATPSDNSRNETESGENAESFKPKDWFVLGKAEGDIDGDKKDDLIAVYSKDNPETEKSDISDEDGDAPRLLIIALQEANGKFRRVFSGSKIILCRYCSGMLGNVVPELKLPTAKSTLTKMFWRLPKLITASK